MSSIFAHAPAHQAEGCPAMRCIPPQAADGRHRIRPGLEPSEHSLGLRASVAAVPQQRRMAGAGDGKLLNSGSALVGGLCIPRSAGVADHLAECGGALRSLAKTPQPSRSLVGPEPRGAPQRRVRRQTADSARRSLADFRALRHVDVGRNTPQPEHTSYRWVCCPPPCADGAGWV